MNHSLLRVSTIVLALIAGPALAQPAPPSDDDHTVLHLSESAQRTVRQDRLTVEMRADVTGPDAARVQAAINKRMEVALETAGAIPAVRSETRGYWVQQERPKDAPARWHGVQILALISTDSATLLKLTGELQQKGLVISSLSYDVAPETARALEDELTAQALQRLHQRIGLIASQMKLDLRNIRNLQVGNVSSGGPSPRPRLMSAMAAEAPPPAAAPGETTLQVNVNADVVLLPHGEP